MTEIETSAVFNRLTPHMDLSQTDTSTLNQWYLDKKFKDTDLPFFNLLKTDLEKTMGAQILWKCCQLRTSFADTLQICELGCDLILIGHHELLFENTKDSVIWKNHLKQLRYPMAHQNDELLKKKLESLPWPYGSKIKFERRGDRSGVEFKVFIASNADLTKVISALERVKEQL